MPLTSGEHETLIDIAQMAGILRAWALLKISERMVFRAGGAKAIFLLAQAILDGVFLPCSFLFYPWKDLFNRGCPRSSRQHAQNDLSMISVGMDGTSQPSRDCSTFYSEQFIADNTLKHCF